MTKKLPGAVGCTRHAGTLQGHQVPFRILSKKKARMENDEKNGKGWKPIFFAMSLFNCEKFSCIMKVSICAVGQFFLCVKKTIPMSQLGFPLGF